VAAGEELAEHHATMIAGWLAMGFGGALYRCDAATDRVQRAIAAAASMHPPYDPLRDWLRSLAWDGRQRLDSWLSDYMGVAPSPHAAAAGRMWLISAVARALEHGCQVDHVLVLEGGQGEGKSSALRCLANGFFGNLPSLRDPVRAASAIRGRWIVEIGELDAIKGSAASATKDFISQPTDRFRPAYARMEITSRRSCVFAGTTNEDQYLEDPTGARRYWPVRCTTIDLPSLARDRNLLWAEAVARYDDGQAWWPTPEERAALAQAAEERQVEDVWEEAILAAAALGEDTTAGLLIRAVGLERSQQSARDAGRVHAIMNRSGYRQVRRRDDSGRRFKAWKYQVAK
jgi:putative DNA primase/helicase